MNDLGKVFRMGEVSTDGVGNGNGGQKSPKPLFLGVITHITHLLGV